MAPTVLVRRAGATLGSLLTTPLALQVAESWTGAQTTCLPSHSTPHPEQSRQELVTALPAALCDSRRGSSCGRSGGVHPLWAPPCSLPYLPLARNLFSLLPIYFDCTRADTATPPWGEGRVQGPACSTFSILELYQIKSLLFVQFFTASIPDCFLSYVLSMLAKAEVIRVSP